jgi:hypothetical protein
MLLEYLQQGTPKAYKIADFGKAHADNYFETCKGTRLCRKDDGKIFSVFLTVCSALDVQQVN